MRAARVRAAWFVLAVAVFAAPAGGYDDFYMPTPPELVRAMLQLAEVGPEDVVYDLGSGDGRIVIMAASEFGAHGVGIEIDRALIVRSNANAGAAGVSDRVRFVREDFFKADLRGSTVVTIYLLSETMQRLQSKLRKELRPGTRIVSHRFRFEGWPPDAERTVEGRTVYLWRVP